MGKARKDASPVGTNYAIKLAFQGARVSSGADFYSYRELDEATDGKTLVPSICSTSAPAATCGTA